MPYLDSKIVGFINFFYDEVQKQKLPLAVNVRLYDNVVPLYSTMFPYLYGDVIIEIIHTNTDLRYAKRFTREQITLSESSPEYLAKRAFEEIRKELDHWN